MEQILNILKEEIKKSMSEEKIDSGKVIELLQIYRRIQSRTITSVSQLQPVIPLQDNDIFIPEEFHLPLRNETATIYDGIIKAAQEMFKSQNCDKEGIQILRYIDWYKFIDDRLGEVALSDAYHNETNKKAKKLRTSLYEKILIEIEKELDKKDKKDEVKEKLYDHIVDGVKKEVDENQENI